MSDKPTTHALGRTHGAVARRVAVLVVLAVLAACTPSGERNPIRTFGIRVDAPGSCDVSGCVGEGVDTATGAFTATVQDLLFPTTLFGIELSRSYRSDRPEAGWFGPGWATIYETTIKADGDGLTIVAPAGLEPQWRPEAPAGWTVAGTVEVSAGEAGTYELSWPSGESWVFDANGRLATMTSPYGQTVTVERVGALPSVIRSSQGLTLTFTGSGERVTSVATNDGRNVDYGFNAGIMVESSAPGLEQRYRYNAEQRLVELAGPSGVTTLTYAAGKVSEQTTAGGQQLRLSYDRVATTVEDTVTNVYRHDSEGRLTAISQGGNDLEVRVFDEDGRLVKSQLLAQPGNRVVQQVDRIYDGNRLTAETVNGVESTFTYDDAGRVTEVVAADGATTFEYEAESLLPVMADMPQSGRQEFAYTNGFIAASTDATGVRTLVTRDSLGNPTSRATSDQSAWTYSFDAEGNIVATTSPTGRVWTADWAPRATLLTETDPLGRKSTYQYDSGGRIRLQSDASGRATEYSYNEAGRVAAETRPDGLTTRYEYAADGSVASITLPGERVWRSETEHRAEGGARVKVTAPDGTMTESLIDSAGRETERRVQEADGSVVELRTFEFGFDRPTVSLVQRGQSRFETRTTYDVGGKVTATVETLDGREVGNTSYQYSAGRVALASANGSSATYSYDDAGRLTQVVSPDDTWIANYEVGRLSTTEHNGVVTQVSYDLDGRANRFVDGAGNITTWAFDEADRATRRSVGETSATFVWSASDQLIRYAAPDGSTWEWSYDRAGRLVEAAEPRGLLTTYEYADGAVSRISTTGDDDRDDRFTYDARGLLLTADTSRGDWEYQYDATGWPVRVDGDGTEEWAYDAQGNVTSIVSDSDNFQLAYDTRGRLQKVTGPEDVLETTWQSDRLASVAATGRDPIRLLANAEGRLRSVRWDDETAVNLEWSADSSLLRVSESGTEKSQDYRIQDGRLASFASADLRITSTLQPNGYLAELRLENNGVEGDVRFDQLGRPATLVTDEASSTLSYDSLGRIASVLTSRPGDDPERTTVTYDGDDRSIDGDDNIVDALFTSDGALRSPLPSSLANPLSASTGVRDPSLLDPTTAGGLLVAPEPRPFDDVASSIKASTPALISPLGVQDLPRLAEQIAVAEVTRLAPVFTVNGDTAVRLPIINPEDGELADYNPFVDAAPSGLALGALSEQDGDDSLLDRAQATLSDIVGGAIAIGGDIARFIIDNPIARFVAVAGTWVTATALCTVGAACLPIAAVAMLIAVGDGVGSLINAGLAAPQACSDRELAKCALTVLTGAVAVVQIAAAANLGVQLLATRAALKGLATAKEAAYGVAQASGRVGVAKSDVLTALRLERVVAREVPVCVGQVCARLDSVTKDIVGRTRLVESKNGRTARFTTNQQAVYPALSSAGGYLPKGLAGGPPQMIFSRLEVQHWGAAANRLVIP